MTADLFAQGLELMLVGMGTVFVFLTLLVLATATMSRLVRRFERQETAPPAQGEQTEEVAAIAAAIAMHRRR